MSELYGFKKNLEKVQVRSKSESAAKSHIVPTLISNTPLAAPATRYEYVTRTIPELANWNVVVLYCKCGNTQQNIVCFRGTNSGNYLIDALTSTVTRGVYLVDWANNRIMVRWVDGRADLAPSFVQILAVYGLVQNVDVVDTDTEDEPSGDEGEDIDISTLTEEVQGIRIGADGTIYETAGEAVREQYNKLAEILNALDVESASETINELVSTAIEQIETAGGLVLDDTLTQSGQAADAGVVGTALSALHTDVDSLNDQINGTGTLTPTTINPDVDGTEIAYFISPTLGTWQSGNRRGYLIALSDCERVSITASASYMAEYAFLSSNTITEGQAAAIVANSLPTSLAAGETATVEVPSGATYLYIRRINSSGYIITPSEILFYFFVPNENPIVSRIANLEDEVSAINTATASDEGKALKVKTVTNGKVTEWEFGEAGGSIVTVDSALDGTSTNPVQNAVIYSALADKADATDVETLDDQINGTGTLTPTTITLSTDATEIAYFISPTLGTWQSGNRRGYLIALSDVVQVSLTADDTYDAEYAFLSSNTITEGQAAAIVGGNLPITLTAETTALLDVPSGATYLYCRRINNAGYYNEPSTVIFYKYSSTSNSIMARIQTLETTANELETRVDNAVSDVDGISAVVPFVYNFTNQTINTSGVISDSTKFLLSELLYVKSGQTFSITAPYVARIVYYSDAGTTVSSVTNWANLYTIASDGYIRLHFRNNKYINDDITAEEVSDGQITTDFAIGKTYLSIPSDNDIEDYVKFDRFNLNKISTGMEDMMWSWWSYPQIMSFKRVRNKLYWAYTTHAGYSGIASYDFDTQKVVKNHLKLATSPDDHNNPAIYVLSDGRIIVQYNESHYSNHRMYIRRSSTPESVEEFEDAIVIDTANYVTYAQFYEYDGTLYMFYRSTTNAWSYMTSTDGGLTWSTETILLTASMQYYLLIAPTTTNGILRLVMYANPNESDPNIRMGFLHCDTGVVYNADNSTSLGLSNIVYTNFSVIIPVETDKTQRLLSVAVTAPAVTRILYCPFTEQAEGTDESEIVYDAVYKIYDSGSVVTVCNAGYTLWKQRYQCGASWIGDDKIVLARSDGTYDYIETYDYNGISTTLDEQIAKEEIGTIPIRNARPVVDVNDKAFIWHRGYYNHDNYRDFNSDTKLHLLV